MNTLLANFNTTERQMTEMFQWPKFLSYKWLKCSARNRCKIQAMFAGGLNKRLW